MQNISINFPLSVTTDLYRLEESEEREREREFSTGKNGGRLSQEQNLLCESSRIPCRTGTVVCFCSVRSLNTIHQVGSLIKNYLTFNLDIDSIKTPTLEQDRKSRKVSEREIL